MNSTYEPLAFFSLMLYTEVRAAECVRGTGTNDGEAPHRVGPQRVPQRVAAHDLVESRETGLLLGPLLGPLFIYLAMR